MKYPTMSQAVDKDHLIELHRLEMDRLRAVVSDKNATIARLRYELKCNNTRKEQNERRN